MLKLKHEISSLTTKDLKGGHRMNISQANQATSIFKNGKPAFLQNQPKTGAIFLNQNGANQKLADLINGKLDNVAISDEAMQLLKQLEETNMDEINSNNDANKEVQTFLNLAKQSLQDLSKDIDEQLKNVDILESETATSEEIAAARENISYIESTANVRGGLFSEKLLNKIVPNAGQAVNAVYEQVKSNSAETKDGDTLLTTTAKTLGLEGISDKSPAEMREILTAAKEKLLQKVSAFDAVSSSYNSLNTKLELEKPKEENEVNASNIEKILAEQLNNLKLQWLVNQDKLND